jgi:hypothetical protein
MASFDCLYEDEDMAYFAHPLATAGLIVALSVCTAGAVVFLAARAAWRLARKAGQR